MRVIIEPVADFVELPTYQHTDDAAMDVYSAVDKVIEVGGRELIPLGFKIQLPDTFALQITPRSGLAYKYGVTVLNSPGLIDPHYPEEVGALLVNHGQDVYNVRRGDRIGQIMLTPIYRVEWDIAPIDGKGERVSGFGSTDKTGVHHE